MAFDYQVRPGLTQAGYNDADIGYDQNRKTVLLKGKDFLNSDKLMNVAGSNFTDRYSFDSALKGYQQQEQQQQANDQSKQRIDALTKQLVNPAMPANPYTSQLDQQIKDLMSMAQNQQQVDPYSTPQYAAYQAQSGRRANEGIRAAQEALGTSGFGRSTALGERAQGIQNQETEYLETQIIPQLIAAAEAKNQQRFANLQSLLNPVQGQQSFFANQAQTERGNAMDALSMLLGEDQRQLQNTRYTDEIQYNRGQDTIANNRNAANDEATFTGNYTSPEKKEIQDKMAANSAAYNTATPEEQARLHAENVALGQQIGLTDSTGNGDYVGNTSTRTMAGQQMDRNNFESDRSYELAKSNQEWNQLLQKATFDLNQAQQIWDNNFKDKSFQQSMNEAAASRGLQWASLDQRDKEFVADQAFREKSFKADQKQRKIDNQAKQSKGSTAEEYAGYVDGVARYDTSQETGNKQLSNPIDVESAILQSNLPESEMRKLYTRYGLKWGG